MLWIFLYLLVLLAGLIPGVYFGPEGCQQVGNITTCSPGLVAWVLGVGAALLGFGIVFTIQTLIGKAKKKKAAKSKFQLFLFTASALNQILNLHGQNTAERQHAEQILSYISNGSVSQAQAAQLISSAPDMASIPPLYALSLPEDLRRTLLRMAFDVAIVDGRITSGESDILHGLAARLGLPVKMLDDFAGRQVSSASGGTAGRNEPGHYL